MSAFCFSKTGGFAAGSGFILLLSLAVSCSPSHRRLQVTAEINELTGAIKSFYADHGYYPVPTNRLSNATVKDVLQVLLAQTESSDVRLLNPELVPYVNVSSGRCLNGDYLDPWGSPYHLVLTTNAVPKLIIGGFTVGDNVAIWSNGRNKKNELGHGDDISSWKKE